MFKFLLAADEASSCEGSNIYMIVAIGVILVLFMVWTYISNRKRGKQMNDMRSTMRIGDEVMTIGGIVGTVVEIRERSATDKEFVIETGLEGSKSTMMFDFRALGENRTRMKEIQAEAARRAEQQRIEKEAKKIKPAAIHESEKEEQAGQNTKDNTDDNK